MSIVFALLWFGYFLVEERQGEPEGGTFAQFAFYADAAAVLLNDGFADVEAESQTGMSTLYAIVYFAPVDAVKTFPDVGLFLWRETGALIFDGDQDLLLLFF